jgi:AbrB family looped-hinge helix DNA binding protein
MRVTSKGQVTIPREIREQAGIRPHSEVSFEFRRGQVVLKPAAGAAARGRAAVERLRGSADNPRWKGKTTDELMALLRGHG